MKPPKLPVKRCDYCGLDDGHTEHCDLCGRALRTTGPCKECWPDPPTTKRSDEIAAATRSAIVLPTGYRIDHVNGKRVLVHPSGRSPSASVIAETLKLSGEPVDLVVEETDIGVSYGSQPGPGYSGPYFDDDYLEDDTKAVSPATLASYTAILKRMYDADAVKTFVYDPPWRVFHIKTTL